MILLLFPRSESGLNASASSRAAKLGLPTGVDQYMAALLLQVAYPLR